MNRKSLITIAVAILGTTATLVVLSVLVAFTRVPSLHIEIGWAVSLLGCALMAWKLRLSPVVKLLVCAGFVLVVRYTAFTIAYALLESGVVWRPFGGAPLSAVLV